MPASENRKFRPALHSVFLLTALLFVYSPPSRCQSVSNGEASTSFSYMRGYAANGGGSFNMGGGSASFAINFKPWLGLVQDAGGYYFSGLGAGIDSRMYTYLVGPRFSRRRPEGRWTPFAQCLLGVSHISVKGSGVSAGENSFAVALGGGVDAAISRHFAVRVAQVEYLRTRFNSETGAAASQNNFRFSAGLVLRFGTTIRDRR
jgi:opacity protein-like surface antigen